MYNNARLYRGVSLTNCWEIYKCLNIIVMSCSHQQVFWRYTLNIHLIRQVNVYSETSQSQSTHTSGQLTHLEMKGRIRRYTIHVHLRNAFVAPDKLVLLSDTKGQLNLL